MKRSTATIDRLIALLVGGCALIGGLLVLGWWAEIGFVRTIFAHADQSWYRLAPIQSWWPWLLGVVAVSAVVLGMWLLLGNIRSVRTPSLELPGSGPGGVLAINPAQIANVAAAALSDHDGISASASATREDGVPMLNITLTARPDISLDQLRRLAYATATDITGATEGTRLATRFYVRYQSVER
ncbi:hypothetical protein FOS14_23615 [Skermania sp. ID1734]|uniref:hypothetical protein n=1 Tax=Skermania sp. ID1734 TaxID=2597516 RepID=UPI00117D7099|nr:hypothetical protein [Skermania sp. ID1734]TSD93187.1 hypothetical protein FOS14_23615 [Skermania sp. ID1734]